MSLAAQIQKPTISSIFLLEITAGLVLSGFVHHSGSTYKVTLTDWVSTPLNSPTAVHQNGTALAEQASAVDVDGGNGRWAFIDGVFYVRSLGGLTNNIFTSAFVATFPFYYSNKPKVLENRYYDPRFSSVPNLSLRIEPRFSGVGQIGSGSCQLANTDGHFDELSRVLKWDFGTAVFKLGADSNSEMAYADYATIGTWNIERTECKDNTFTVTLKERKNNLEREIPFEVFERADYPLMSDSDIGQVIPRAYGRIYGAKPYLIDPGAKRFKLAGHAIHDIIEVRIKQDNVWTVVNTLSRDLANAEFTLGATWSDNEPVSVDFVGMKLADGRPMYNAASIVEDILEYIGESNFDTDSFTAAFNSLDIGVQSDGIRHSILKPSLYLRESEKASEVISKINQVASSFLYVSTSGQWHYEVFKPKPLSAADHAFTERDILDRSFVDETDAAGTFSQVNVRYAHRTEDEYFQILTRRRRENRYAHSPSSEIPKEIDAPLWDASDAELYAERLLTTEGLPLRRFRFEVPQQALLVLPGDTIHLQYSPGGINALIEVLEVRYDLNSPKVLIVAGDRRGWGDSFGFWVGDSQPAWSAGDSDATKLTNRQSSGFWQGADSLAISTDGKSFQTGRWW